MSVSDKIGSFDLLSIWNLSPMLAALVVLAADFGLVNALMAIEGRFGRGRYLSFLVNDLVLYPVVAAMTVIVLRHTGPSDAWYTEAWWQWACLAVPLMVSIGIEVGAVRDGTYTMAQELSPSKLAHTLVFGVMGYWIISPLPAVFDTTMVQGTAPVLPFVVSAVCLVAAVIMVAKDRIIYLTDDMATAPHIEWGAGRSPQVNRAPRVEKCPGCDAQLPADDMWAQKRHMEQHHPEIIEQRMRDAKFVKVGDRWVDTLAGPYG